MARGPSAASMKSAEAALGTQGASDCELLVQTLGATDKAALERAARTLKKIAERDGAVLLRWRKQLIAQAMRASDVRVQWNLTIVLGKLPLKGRDRALVIDLMFERLQDRSGLNRTFALQALVDMSGSDAALRARIMPVLDDFLAHGTPAMRARARRLLGVKRT